MLLVELYILQGLLAVYSIREFVCVGVSLTLELDIRVCLCVGILVCVCVCWCKFDAECCCSVVGPTLLTNWVRNSMMLRKRGRNVAKLINDILLSTGYLLHCVT